MIKEVNQDNWQAEVMDASNQRLVLVDFWAEWCGPCKMLGPILEEVDKEVGDKVIIAKLNVEENQAKAQEHNVMGIPNLKFFKNGQVVDDVVGVRTKEQLVELINKNQ